MKLICATEGNQQSCDIVRSYESFLTSTDVWVTKLLNDAVFTVDVIDKSDERMGITYQKVRLWTGAVFVKWKNASFG